jgi:hypothetical protein
MTGAWGNGHDDCPLMGERAEPLRSRRLLSSIESGIVLSIADISGRRSIGPRCPDISARVVRIDQFPGLPDAMLCQHAGLSVPGSQSIGRSAAGRDSHLERLVRLAGGAESRYPHRLFPHIW